MTESAASQNSTTVRSENKVRLTRVALQAAYIVSGELGTGFAERLFTSPRRHDRPERERAVLASGRPFAVDVALRAPRWHGQHVNVAAWRWGYGPAVMLVHGWEGRASQLGAFVEPLVAAGLSVVAFDAPAHGDSPGGRLYLPDHADAIADVAAQVGPLHGIVAHSFGAAAVLLAHGRHGIAAERNVMISPNAIIDDAVARFAHHVGLDDRDRHALQAHLEIASGVPLAALKLPALVGAREQALLVVHDRADREVPFVHGERLAQVWGGAALRETSGLGHRKILRDPGVIAQVAAFVGTGVRPAVSDLVREVDRWLDA
jgi:predicted alpha/beta hydrolase family esterase